MHLNFACILTHRRVKQRRYYSRSPHCCTASLAGVYPPFLMNGGYCCGVAEIHLDTGIISHLSRGFNGGLLQFSCHFFGNFDHHRQTGTISFKTILSGVTLQSIASTVTPAFWASRNAAPKAGSVASFGCKNCTFSI